MAMLMKEYMDEGLVNIVGGCCGTTNEHISYMALLAAERQPRKPVPYPTDMWLSGLDRLVVNRSMNFINIGERCNVAGSR